MTRKPPTNGRCSTAQLEPAAHPERVPLHHMTRDQHTAGEERKRAGGEDKGHKRRETQRDKKQRPGNQTPEEETGNKDTTTTTRTTTTTTTTTTTRPPNMPLHSAALEYQVEGTARSML